MFKDIKILYLVSICILITLLFSVFFIHQYKKSSYDQIVEFQKFQNDKKLETLKDMVNCSYTMIDETYNDSVLNYNNEIENVTDEIINVLSVNRLIFTLNNIRELKFDNDGFISINDFDTPYTVRLHPQKPVLEGSDWIFYVNKENPINIYELFHNTIVEGKGEGVVNYNFYEFNSDSITPMVGYIKLYEGLNWVIGSSVSLSEMQKENEEQLLKVNSDFRILQMKVIASNLILLMIWVFVFLIFRKKQQKLIV